MADSPRKGQCEEEEDAAALLLRLKQANVAAPDLLAALLRSASCPGEGDFSYPGSGTGVVDAGVLLRFFALHRASVLAGSKAAALPGLPDTCLAFSAAKEQDDAQQIGPAAAPEDGPSNKRNKKVAFNAAQPAAGSAAEYVDGHHIAAPEAGRKRGRRKKKVAFGALDAHNAAGYSAQQPATGIANGAPKKAKKKKKKARNGSGQGQHPGKPAALILEFARGFGSLIESKEELLSTFRGFGSLIESDADIGARRARLVFGSRAAAEAAYSCAHTLGTFSGRRLQYMRPPPLAPRIPLMDVRKNLERMISSLTGPSLLRGEGALDLAGQMMCLMAKVDKTLCAAGAPGPSTHHRH